MSVLVVEDSKLPRKVLVSYLEKMGYEVFEAENGTDGYRLWREHHPRLVLTDWNMPSGTGIELITKIRSHSDLHYSYIILITSREAEEDLTVGFESGADDYIIKPVNRQELVLRMRAGERLLSLQTKDQLLFAMAKLAEARDLETGQHLDRIRQYAKVLAEALAKEGPYQGVIDQQFIKGIYETSPLHDIGKVGIPDSILRKPGKLTPEEFEVMKTHSSIGTDTLLTIETTGSRRGSLLKMALDIAGGHHERWDGSGYPNALHGDQIPLSARIVALVDVYDALRSKRPYKEPWDHNTVVSYIQTAAGSHFDPAIVTVFLQIAPQFDEIAERFR